MGEENGVTKPTDLEKKVIRQIEYYFGNFNLPRDKFLQEQIKLDDGWIPLDVMLKFNRLSNITKDKDVIAAALAKSTEKLMEISEDKQKIRRSPDKPLPQANDDAQKETVNRMVYCKGFPKEGTTLDMLLTFFAEHGPVETVKMRRFIDKEHQKSGFKGSVFIVFETKELAEAFLQKESVKYNDTELIRKWQTVYCEEKKKEVMAKKESRKRKNKGSTKKDDDGNEKEEAEEEEEEEEKKPKNTLPKGAIVYINGISKETTREDIKDALTKLGAEVAFVDFNKGDEEGWIRLDEENAAVVFMEKLKENGEKLEIGGKEIAIRLLEGEEEEQFLKKTMEQIEKRRTHAAQFKRGRRGRGHRGGWKRRGDFHRDGPPSKRRGRQDKGNESD